MTRQRSVIAASILLAATACSGGNDTRPGSSAGSPAAQDKPAIMRTLDGIPGWTQTGDVETYTKDGLYGYIDGGAEIVFQYGFRELAVFKFKPAVAAAPVMPPPLAVPAKPAGPGLPVSSTGTAKPVGSPALPAPKELVLEIYRMGSGEAAFGIYSTKLEGEEEGWPGIQSDHWVSPGQGGLVKGEYMINILAPECASREIGEFAAALEPKIPGEVTVRPKGLAWLPPDGMVAGSWKFIKGLLAAQNESPFLERDFWGFGGADGAGATEAYSAKYGVAPAVSKLVVVKLGKSPAENSLEESVLAVFKEYLKDVRRDGETLEGKNEAGRWFLFGQKGRFASLVLGDPDHKAAQTRLDIALALALASR